MSRSHLLQSLAWPALIAGSAAATALTVYGDALSPLRPVIVLWFLVVCPGMAYVRLLRLGNAVTTWTLAVALSFGINSLIAMVMVYTGWWRPEHGLAVLLAVTSVGVLLSLVGQARQPAEGA